LLVEVLINDNEML
jgi:alpha-glucosidase (family GH31 glycosyl hydrolase)